MRSQIAEILAEAELRDFVAGWQREVALRRQLALLKRGPTHPALIEHVITLDRLVRQRNAATAALDALAPRPRRQGAW
jgi:hypothetical protein